MKKIILILIVLVVLILFFFLPSEDDTTEIESIFDGVLKAGKEKDLEGVMDHFSINYRDEYGATYPVVKNVIEGFFAKYDSFDGNYSELKVSINDSDKEKMAVANLDFYVNGIKTGNSIPIFGNEVLPENVTVTLEKNTFGDWKIKKVEGLSIDE